MPRDLLFPPLATQVRLGGVRSVGEGGWSRESCVRLHEMLSMAGEDLEVVTVGRGGVEGIHEVEIFVRQDMSRQRRCLPEGEEFVKTCSLLFPPLIGAAVGVLGRL